MGCKGSAGPDTATNGQGGNGKLNCQLAIKGTIISKLNEEIDMIDARISSVGRFMPNLHHEILCRYMI